ncbi:MAG: HAD hydrolase-like protein [Chloroflexi bacterium]|nr:HAD hydrolase-like protein [Chloroflexota bacterium]
MDAATEGAVPLLEELSRRMPVGAISNGPSIPQRQRLEAMGVSGLFSCIVLSEEIGIKKPDQRKFSTMRLARYEFVLRSVCT